MLACSRSLVVACFAQLVLLALAAGGCANRPVIIKECAPPLEDLAFYEDEVGVLVGESTVPTVAAGETLSFGGACTGSVTPLARTSAPPLAVASGGPGATLIEGVESFSVDGLEVILKHTPDKPVVAAGLYIRGGSSNLSPQTAGLEELTLDLMAAGGSQSLPREAMFEQLNGMGTVINSGAGRVYSSLSMQSVGARFEESFRIFADVITDPALPEDELERQRARGIEFLRGLDEDADTWVSVLGQDLLFEDHPYALRQWGTIENLERFTRDDLVAYHQGLLTRERLLLVVVGDVERGALEGLVRETLAKLPTGGYQPPTEYAFKACGGRMTTYAADTATSYVMAFFRAPSPGDQDYYPLMVGLALLRSRLFEKVRTKLELSYAVSAGLSNLPANYGYLYATSSYPAHALAQIYDEVESMQDWLVNATELEQQVEVFITDTYMALETLGAQREMLASAHLMRGDWRYSAELIDRVREVGPQDVRRAMQTWVRDFQVGYYGPAERLPAELAMSNPQTVDRSVLEALGLSGPTRR